MSADTLFEDSFTNLAIRSRGIGLETARQLYKMGATVYIGARTEEKATNAIKQIQADVAESVGQLKWFLSDLSTIKGSRESAERFLKMENQLDILGECSNTWDPSCG